MAKGNLRMMIGEIVSVQAFASIATRGFQVEDTVAIAFRFANGALGTRQLEHFIAVIRGEVQPLVTGRDALQNLRVTEAVVRAARTGSIIHITKGMIR